jgi:hypothetical protein
VHRRRNYFHQIAIGRALAGKNSFAEVVLTLRRAAQRGVSVLQKQVTV